MSELTEAEAVERALRGDIVWDDELPESMRGYGVPVMFRDLLSEGST